jgi:hypothetical protein
VSQRGLGVCANTSIPRKKNPVVPCPLYLFQALYFMQFVHVLDLGITS